MIYFSNLYYAIYPKLFTVVDVDFRQASHAMPARYLAGTGGHGKPVRQTGPFGLPVSSKLYLSRRLGGAQFWHHELRQHWSSHAHCIHMRNQWRLDRSTYYGLTSFAILKINDASLVAPAITFLTFTVSSLKPIRDDIYLKSDTFDSFI